MDSEHPPSTPMRQQQPGRRRADAGSPVSIPPDDSAYYASHQPPPPARLPPPSSGDLNHAAAAARLLHPLNTEIARSGNRGDYSPNMVDSPRSTLSDDSMDDRLEATPTETPPNADSPGTEVDQFARLSVEQRRPQTRETLASPRGRDWRAAPSLKRSPSSELPRPPGRRSPEGYAPRMKNLAGVRSPRPGPRSQQRRVHVASPALRPPSNHDAAPTMVPGHALQQFYSQNKLRNPVARDSGYESAPSRAGTLQQPALATIPSPKLTPAMSFELMQGDTVQRHNGLIQLPANSRYPGLILQPDSCPISQEQLAAEVKGIYAGLVMVEAKCINMDATQAANPNSHLVPGQWQALIALHRTLLYEHHDFLMATQHPSASEALRGLAAKYSMPARMWKHGIHAFLEVLRHRRPDSQDYMLAFIYLAYQMMALLFETVPTFTDTWIECLGDLARYRMAIEEEKEPHATWGSVAARWYIMASDRHPAVGRLYHHLGILERPSLRKLCLYAKSLTCVIPFPNARDSLATLSAPIVQDEDAIQSSSQNMEARTVTFYALIYSGHRNAATVERVATDALDLIRSQPAKLRDNAAYLAYTNVAALFELGSPMNALWQVYATAINQSIQQSRATAAHGSPAAQWQSASLTDAQMTPALSFGMKFCTACFNLILRREDDRKRRNETLPFAYVMLVFLHSLYMVRTRLVSCGFPLDTFGHLVEPAGFSWAGLADYLNSLVQHEPIEPHIQQHARQGMFPASQVKQDARPLAEDYLIRGSLWCQFYFIPGWFDGQTEDDGRAIETPSMQRARAERVKWLGLFLAFHTEHLHYDLHTKQFSAVGPATVAGTRGPSTENTVEPSPEDATPSNKSPETPSSSSQSDDGFTIVKKPSIQPSYATVAANAKPAARLAQRPPPPPPKKRKQDNTSIKVLDEDSIALEVNSGYQEYP